MWHFRTPGLAMAAVIAALAVGACGSDDEAKDATAASESTSATVDDAEVEKGIEESLTTSSATVSSAKCPADVKVKTGGTFTCDVTFDSGATGKATVTQNGRERYTYELKAGSVQVPGSVAEAAVAEQLAAQGAPNATVDCPQNIIVKVGTTVTCNVSGAQGAANGSVTWTFSDAEGTVDPESVETA